MFHSTGSTIPAFQLVSPCPSNTVKKKASGLYSCLIMHTWDRCWRMENLSLESSLRGWYLVIVSYFPHAKGKIVWPMAYSVFVSSATIMALQSDCFMQRTSRTATNGDQGRLGGSMVLQETKNQRTTSEGMPGLLWTSGVCFWACQLALWSS